LKENLVNPSKVNNRDEPVDRNVPRVGGVLEVIEEVGLVGLENFDIGLMSHGALTGAEGLRSAEGD